MGGLQLCNYPERQTEADHFVGLGMKHAFLT